MLVSLLIVQVRDATRPYGFARVNPASRGQMDGDLKLALLADPIAEMEAAVASRNGSMSTQSTRLLAARLSPWRGS